MPIKQKLPQAIGSQPRIPLLNLVISSLLLASSLSDLTPSVLATEFGINNGTGYNTDPEYVYRSIKYTKNLNLKRARVGIDGIGGRAVGAPFDWAARDATVQKYLDEQVFIHAVVSARGHVDKGGSYEEWKSNFKYFVRAVMQRYKGKISYYIVDNEPDLDFGQGTMSAREAVDMTRIAYEAARSIDPNIKIESPPVSGIESAMLSEMLDLGVDKVSDYIGVHAYGGQIEENRLGHPWRELAKRNIKKPITISESGAIVDWCKGSDFEKELCRQQWFEFFFYQANRFGYSYVLLFDLDSHDQWAIAPNFNPTSTYEAIKRLPTNQRFLNGNFESNQKQKGWVAPQTDTIQPSPYITFVSGDAAGAHSGNGYIKMDSGKAKQDTPIYAKQVVSFLPKGTTVAVEAWVYASGEATGTLKALGYNRLDGDAEISVPSTQKNTWQKITMNVPISKDSPGRFGSFVVALSTTGTEASNSFVMFDDVSIKLPAGMSWPENGETTTPNTEETTSPDTEETTNPNTEETTSPNDPNFEDKNSDVKESKNVNGWLPIIVRQLLSRSA